MTRSKGLLLCSTAALMIFGAVSQAATPAPSETAPVMAAGSYADLLMPIPNATALLEADNQARSQQTRQMPQATIELAQYHHHHHHHYRRYHHHHHAYFPWGVVVPPPAYYGRHCYWTWGERYWNGYRWVRRHIRVCD